MKQKVTITSTSLRAITIKKNEKLQDGWKVVKGIRKWCFGYKLKMEKDG